MVAEEKVDEKKGDGEQKGESQSMDVIDLMDFLIARG